jgi:hypothetical protein
MVLVILTLSNKSISKLTDYFINAVLNKFLGLGDKCPSLPLFLIRLVIKFPLINTYLTFYSILLHNLILEEHSDYNKNHLKINLIKSVWHNKDILRFLKYLFLSSILNII